MSRRSYPDRQTIRACVDLFHQIKNALPTGQAMASSTPRMFDASLYHSYYHHALLALTVLSALIYAQGQSKGGVAAGYNAGQFWLFSLTFITIIGTRPVSGIYFVDMSTYAQSFEAVAAGRPSFHNDVGFGLLTELSAQALSVTGYFVLCSALYVLPIMVAVHLTHARWAFAVLLTFAGGFSFYTYGVNGIRNGIATSVLLAAFALHNRRLAMMLLMVVAISIHKSVAIPAAAFLACTLYANVTACGVAWIMALAASLAFGDRLSTAVGGLISIGGDDERLLSYATGGAFGGDRGGFRIDFVLYSIVPVAIAYALAETQTRRDQFFRRLLSAYLITNATWLLMMYAAFSNRFAYLSWFMMPWVIIYPFVPKREQPGMPLALQNSHTLLPVAIIAHYSFTYIMQMFVYQGRG